MSSCLFVKYILIIIIFALFTAISFTREQTVEEKQNDDEFVQVLAKSSGVYMNKELAIKSSLLNPNILLNIDKTVIVTSVNFGYLNHLHNLKCYMDQIGFKILVFALDIRTHEYIINNMMKEGNMFSYLLTHGEGIVSEASANFATKEFHVITTRKKEAVLDVLKQGYNALFIDPDIAVLSDPLPYMMWKNVDYVHSINWICPHCKKWDFHTSQEEGNTGFYYVQSNLRTIKLFEEVIKESPKFPALDDQSIFWTLIRSIKNLNIKPLIKCSNYEEINTNITTNQIITCHLDGCLFSVGALRGVAYVMLIDNLKKQDNFPISIHANFMKGNDLKMKSLMKHGYWLTTPNKDTKLSYGGFCRIYSYDDNSVGLNQYKITKTRMETQLASKNSKKFSN